MKAETVIMKWMMEHQVVIDIVQVRDLIDHITKDQGGGEILDHGTKVRILEGLKDTGSYKECLQYIFEGCTRYEYDTIEAFFTWLTIKKLTIGHGNIDDRLQEWWDQMPRIPEEVAAKKNAATDDDLTMIRRGCLKRVLEMAESFNEDLESGLDEGLYQDGDPAGNAEVIAEANKAVQ